MIKTSTFANCARSMKKSKLVMIGNGMAGVRTLEELLKIAPEQYDITVFGAEPHPNYNRILLSPVLAGEQTLEEIVLNPLSWYAEHGITLHLGKKVSTIDRVKRRVIAEDGTEAEYDRLLLATHLGKMCNIHYGAICELELGKRDSHILTLKNIADKLGVDVKKFL